MENHSKRKWNDTILVLYITSIIIVFVSEAAGMFLYLLPIDNPSDVWITARLYMSFIGFWIVLPLFFCFTKKNRSFLTEIGPKSPGNTGKLLLAGILIGFGLNTLCVLIAWLHKDIALTFNSFQPASLLFVFICVFIQSSAEEVLCRVFLYQRLRKSYKNPAVAIIGNSALFAMLHLLNNGITALSFTNCLLSGIMFSFVVYYWDSVWCAMALHASWNFTQNIIFGLPNSGLVLPFSIFKLDASAATNSFAYDVGFGIEGAIITTIALAGVSIAIYYISKRRKSSL